MDRLFKYIINTNLHKLLSTIHTEVLVFSFIPVIQAELNQFMRTQNCRNIQNIEMSKCSEMLFNVPAIDGFPK